MYFEQEQQEHKLISKNGNTENFKKKIIDLSKLQQNTN